MKQKTRQRVFFVSLFACCLSVGVILKAGTFFGTIPTGLVELKDYKYPVFLFVPENYKADRDYPLIVSVPAEGESAEKNIKYWVRLAKSQSLIVVAPTNLRPEDLPTKMDEWLLSIKKDVMQRYRITSRKIYLVGLEGGAHYAAYLGVKYPEEFSAVALLGGSWIGKFEKLMRLQSKPRKQRPFYVAMTQEDPALFEKTRQRAFQFEKKGYPVSMEPLEKKEDLSSDEFKKKLVTWFEEKSESWQRVVEDSKKKFKEKAIITFEDLFHV